VTTVAVLRRVLEDAIHMTGRTWSRDVRACQRKCRAVVVKIRSPAEGIDFVAFLAVRRKPGEGVTGFLGVLIVSTVTTEARDSGSRVFVVRDVHMAIFAMECGMSAK
jgi:hypothetical protein